MKKLLWFIITIIFLIGGSWYVYNNFLYNIVVEDISDSYFTYTGDIYTGTREDNGFYRMIDYFADPQNEQIISGLNSIDQINLSTGNSKNGYYDFYQFFLTGTIGTGEVYVESLDRIEKDINHVLYSGFNLYNILYVSGSQLSGYDQFVNGLEIINNLSWQYENGDIENYFFKQYYLQPFIRSLLTISVLSCYLKDHDRCYNYWSQAYQLSRNILYSKGPTVPSLVSMVSYGSTLKTADFLIENNMIDDVIYKKILDDLDSGNIYDTEQIVYNMKVSEYNFFRYMIYNPEEGQRRLGGTVVPNERRGRSNAFQQQFFFDQDLTHIWLKNILKNNININEGYTYNKSYWYRNSDHSLVKYWNNPEFNIYGFRLLIINFPRFNGVTERITERFSYRDRVLQKYKNYTPIITTEEIITGSNINLSGVNNISGMVLENNNFTGDTDSLDIKKDFPYC